MDLKIFTFFTNQIHCLFIMNGMNNFGVYNQTILVPVFHFNFDGDHLGFYGPSNFKTASLDAVKFGIHTKDICMKKTYTCF